MLGCLILYLDLGVPTWVGGHVCIGLLAVCTSWVCSCAYLSMCVCGGVLAHVGACGLCVSQWTSVASSVPGVRASVYLCPPVPLQGPFPAWFSDSVPTPGRSLSLLPAPWAPPPLTTHQPSLLLCNRDPRVLAGTEAPGRGVEKGLRPALELEGAALSPCTDPGPLLVLPFRNQVPMGLSLPAPISLAPPQYCTLQPPVGIV